MDYEDATKSAETMKILMTFCIIGCIVKFLVVLFFATLGEFFSLDIVSVEGCD